MIDQLLWKKLLLEKNKILNFPHLKNVTLAKAVVLNQDMMLVLAQCVVVMVKLAELRHI